MVAILVLSSCERQDPWTLQTIRAGNSDFNSSKLAYATEDQVNGLDLEILSSKKELRIALLVHSHPVPAYDLDEKKALVKISSPEKQIVTLASRREGGQRLILPEKVHPFILSTLKNGEPLTLQVPGYKSTVMPKKFSTLLEKLEHPSPFELIIHLPM